VAYLLGLVRRASKRPRSRAHTEEALSTIDKTGERFWEAELYRVKGELTLHQFEVHSSKFKIENPQSAFRLPPPSGGSPQSEAEACFLKAVEIARQQEAKSLELRATVSLARLWRRQDKHHAARNTLSAIYHWFTEGLETANLREAKELLDELTDEAGLDAT
jgi:adenylate cyclase